MELIDIHIHTSMQGYDINKEQFVSGAQDMRERLIETGVRRGVLMSSGENDKIPGNNEECRKICEIWPQMYSWMCNLDMVSLKTLGKRMEGYKAQGAVGIGELMINKPFTAPFLQAVFHYAEELKLPVLFHLSPEEGFQYGVVDHPGLPLLEETLKAYPNLTLIGHSQPFWHEISGNPGSTLSERQQWGSGPVAPGGRLVELFLRYPNLYGDLSANSGGCAIMRDEAFGLWFLHRFQDRLMFGSDMVNVTMNFPLAGWLQEMYAQGKLALDTYEKIAGKNAERILL